jgi:hypothetical protein
MRFRQKSWAILVVVALAFTTAVSAAAKPDCDVDPTHRSCKTAVAGTECVVWSPSDPYAYAESGDFDLTVEDTGSVCIDVSEVVAGDWEVTIDVTEGSLRELLVIVRDSIAPGDTCASTSYKKNKIPDSPFTFTLPVNADNHVNACGIEFAEMVDNHYYAAAEEETPSPLSFVMFFQGSSDLVFTVEVDYPNPS